MNDTKPNFSVLKKYTYDHVQYCYELGMENKLDYSK